MIIQNKFYTLELSDQNAELVAFSGKKRKLIQQTNQPKPLLEIKLLDKAGTGIYVSSSDAKAYSVTQEGDRYTISFEEIAPGLSAKVFLRCPEEAFCYWSCEVSNKTGNIIEWVGLPGITVANDLKAAGGDSCIFWPAGEGCLIDDISVRSASDWLHYRELTYQSIGYSGLYPASNPMQFMAYYNEVEGLYLAATDTQAHLKAIEFYPYEDGICLEMRLFADGATDYQLGYEIVMGVFEGDWHDAADIYREWMYQNSTTLPKKICENENLPEWYSDSPIVAVYPIRGTKDTGDMTPNLYYPFENVLPYIEQYNEQFQSRIMALPMHWEGTAPWAPPYVWPPFGGEEQFLQFAEKLHAKDNLLGVYCSGIGWTVHSYLNELDISDKYQEKFICKTPDGKIVQSNVIGPPIRDGYDMCPESEEVAQIVHDEVAALYHAGCDYTQYFDQNLGGNSCLCYADDHGHPAAPGKWQADAMVRIFEKIEETVDPKKMLIGCECAAAEPFLRHLPFNDLRYIPAFISGKPVPAYSYLFHEYINNFMGNQCGIHGVLDLEKCPDNTLFRIAYSFTAGDMLTINLAKDGMLFWGWGTEWTVEPPNQEHIRTLIGNLNIWRRGFAKKYLHLGKMLKPEQVEGIGTYALITNEGREIVYPDVLTACYEAPDKKQALLLTNYLHEEKEVVFSEQKKIYTDATDETKFVIADCITVKPLSCLIAEAL